jgi:hypothetical protein
LWDRSLYSDLCREAYAATHDFLAAQFPDLEGAAPAMFITPQSFGSLLNFHPHLHGVLSLGVFDLEAGGSFHPLLEDFDSKPLEEIFRARTLKLFVGREKITEERGGDAPGLGSLGVPGVGRPADRGRRPKGARVSP